MWIAMAGLPGTGKSTLAAELARRLPAVILSKDVVRAALFPAPVLDFSTAQDDLCMDAIYRTAALLARTHPQQTIILDGRTFLREYQVRQLLAQAESAGQDVRWIECVCAAEVVRERLEADQATARHPAGHRSMKLYEQLKASAQPITEPQLVVDTGAISLPGCVQRCLEYVRNRPV